MYFIIYLEEKEIFSVFILGYVNYIVQITFSVKSAGKNVSSIAKI